MTRFIVYASKLDKIIHRAMFTVDAVNEKQAEKLIKEELEATCLAERLRLDNENTETDEGKIHVFAEEVDECNKKDADKAEYIDFPNLKLSQSIRGEKN